MSDSVKGEAPVGDGLMPVLEDNDLIRVCCK